MNKKTKLLLIGVIVTSVLSSVAFADEREDYENDEVVSHEVEHTNTGNFKTNMPTIDSKKLKEYRKKFRENIEENREKTKDKIKEMKEKMKHDNEEFRENIKEKAKLLRKNLKTTFKDLDDNVKKQVREIRKEYIPQIKKYIEEFKNATKEQREVIKEKIENLREEMKEKIENITKGTEYEKQFEEKMEQMKQMREQRKQMLKEKREEIKEIRKEFKESRQDLVVKWKKVIYTKLMGKIEKMSLAKLEKIDTKIDKAVTKIKNGRLSEDRKVKIISALDALKQAITERIEKLKAEKDNIGNEMDVINDILSE